VIRAAACWRDLSVADLDAASSSMPSRPGNIPQKSTKSFTASTGEAGVTRSREAQIFL
jgi:hypothetical protein